MNRLLKRWRRRIAVAVLGLGLALTSAFDQPVRAQPPSDPAEPAAPGSGSGRPFDGYMGTSILAFLALFIVAKSARR
jgi:hypothetical protein